MKEKTLGHLACFIAYAIFGINIIVCKDLTSSRLISPIALFCLRSLGAGSLFWIISCFLPKEKVEKAYRILQNHYSDRPEALQTLFFEGGHHCGKEVQKTIIEYFDNVL